MRNDYRAHAICIQCQLGRSPGFFCCLGPEYEWRGPYPDGDATIPLAKLPREARL